MFRHALVPKRMGIPSSVTRTSHEPTTGEGGYRSDDARRFLTVIESSCRALKRRLKRFHFREPGVVFDCARFRILRQKVLYEPQHRLSMQGRHEVYRIS